MDKLLIILILGMIILDISFFFQILKIWTKKHSFGLSLSSWTINMIGRVIWIFYGMLLSTKGGIVLTVGQGLCGLMTVPIIYYIIRNRKTQGEYVKEHFDKKLFFLRVFTKTLIIVSIISCIIFGVFAIKHHDHLGDDRTILILSIIGSAFTGLSFLPQTIKTIKTLDTKSTSLYLCIAFIIGNSLMICFLLIKAIQVDVMKYIPGVIFTSISVISMSIIAGIKVRNIVKLRQSID